MHHLSPRVYAISALAVTLLSAKSVRADPLVESAEPPSRAREDTTPPTHAASFSPATPPSTPSTRVVGGELVETCAWPSTVHMGTSGGGTCTGTLVHPRVVTYAGHCNNTGKPSSWTFGEQTPWEKTVQVSQCQTHPQFSGSNFGQGVDYAFCVLAEEVVDVPITPVLMGCEVDAVIKEGASVTIVGYGNTAGKPNGGGGGIKRFVEVPITEVKSNGEVTVGASGMGACHGDSGGPLFVQLPSELDPERGWRVFGVTSFGPDNCPGEPSHFGSLFDEDAAPWIEQTSGIDITPCHDADGSWNPSADCGGFHVAPGEPDGATWANMCMPPELSGLSSTCGPPFGDDDDGDDDDGDDDDGDDDDGDDDDGDDDDGDNDDADDDDADDDDGDDDDGDDDDGDDDDGDDDDGDDGDGDDDDDDDDDDDSQDSSDDWHADQDGTDPGCGCAMSAASTQRLRGTFSGLVLAVIVGVRRRRALHRETSK